MSYTRFASGDVLDDWYIYWDVMSGTTKESQILAVWASTKVLAERGADPDGLFYLTWDDLDKDILPLGDGYGIIPGWPPADGPERQALMDILKEWHFEMRAAYDWWRPLYDAWGWISNKWWRLSIRTWRKRWWEEQKTLAMARLLETYGKGRIGG